ncbi:MAG: OsmC family protein [Putridiphycobacter sp.]
MKIGLKYYKKDLIFQVNNNIGYPVLIGQAAENSKVKTIRPMETILMGLAACSSVDIVNILQKQKIELEDYNVEVEGNREQDKIPALFNNIKLIITVKSSSCSTSKLKRAVQLSLNKYCSVSKILEPTTSINYKIILNGKEI